MKWLLILKKANNQMPSKKPQQSNLCKTITFLLLKPGDYTLQYQGLQENAFTCNEVFSPSSTPLPAAVLRVVTITWL